MILVDSSGLFAVLDDSQPAHEAAARALATAGPPFILSPFVLAELDYFLATRIGAHAELELLDEVAGGAYQLETFDRGDMTSALGVLQKYKNLDLGLADASIVVLADRHNVSDVLTLDERHFRTVRRSGGGRFRILPADA